MLPIFNFIHYFNLTILICLVQDPQSGIIPRVLNHIFDELRLQQLEFTMGVSYLELYNEELIDLLSPLEDTTKLR